MFSISPNHFLRSLVFGLVLPGSSAWSAETVQVPVPVQWEAETAGSEPSKDERPFMIVRIEGTEAPLRLPVAIDTTLLQKGEVPRDKDRDIQLRDSRWHQGLYRIDVSSVPKDARILSAAFEFTIGWVERKGGARIEFHRMLADWSAVATWVKPRPETESPWNGLAAGRDYEAVPIAAHAADEAVNNQRITLEGFGPLVADWVSGRQPNHGFVAQLYGKAVQVNLKSSETPVKKPVLRQLRLPADAEVPLRLSVDLELIRRLLLAGDDLRGAGLRLSILGKDDLAATRIQGGGGHGIRLEGRELVVSGFGDELRESLRQGGKTASLGFTLRSSRPLALGGPDGGRDDRPVFLIETKSHGHEQLWENKIVPRPGVYVERRGGNLYYGGERLRLWGAVGYGNIARMRRMGFNAWRVWPVGDRSYDERSIVSGSFVEAVKGDGSDLDRIDRMFGEFKENGFFLMATQLMGVMPPKLLLRDDSFVAGGEDWEAWKTAVKALAGGNDAGGSAAFRRMAFVDERARKARFKHAVNFLNRVNPYTGKRYAEEEHIAIWELDNELGFVRHVLEGGALKWPAYFKDKLDARWTEWVHARYPSEVDLIKAWGRLETGESYGKLQGRPVAAQARTASSIRLRDFTQFVIGLADGFYQDLRETARSQAPQGVGAAVAPFSFDTQYRPSIPWIYQQSLGDVANFGMYFWDTSSQLSRPPAAYVMDSHTVDDKLTVIYETNQARPSPYRTEYPFRLAALASWQDWDALFFHYWSGDGSGEDEEFLTRPMKYMTVSHYWDAVHHDQDPAMTSMMAAAGRIFLSGAIPPAPSPALYRIGAKGIFSNRFADGLGMREDTFARGARLRFEPQGDFDLIKENAGDGTAPPGAVHSGNAVDWDWPSKRLIIDTPQAKVYVGPAPAEGWSFRDGITLSGVSAPWLSFALVSADGLPLAECSKAHLTSMSDAVNTGFEFDWQVRGGPVDQAKAVVNPGRAPVRVDKVDYSVSFPRAMDWKVKSYDFALRPIAATSGESGVLRVRSQPAADAVSTVSNARPQEIWMNVVHFNARGESVKPVIDASAGASAAAKASRQPVQEATDPALAGLWNPLPGLGWGDNLPLAQRKIAAMNVRHGAVTPLDGGDDSSLTVAESHAVFDAPARTEISFSKQAMKDIVVTFSQPPSFRAAVADYEGRFGMPAEKRLADDPFEQSTVRWMVPGKAVDLAILMTEAQGVMKVVFSLIRK